MGGAVRRRENPFRKRIILIGFNSDHALGACDASLAKNFSTCAVELRSMTLKASLFLRPDGSKPAELERPSYARLPVAFQRAFLSLSVIRRSFGHYGY